MAGGGRAAGRSGRGRGKGQIPSGGGGGVSPAAPPRQVWCDSKERGGGSGGRTGPSPAQQSKFRLRRWSGGPGGARAGRRGEPTDTGSGAEISGVKINETPLCA